MVRNESSNKEKDKDLDQFLFDRNDDDLVDEEQQEIEGVKYESESSSDGDDANRRAQPDSFSSQQWPQSYKYIYNHPLHHFLIISF